MKFNNVAVNSFGRAALARGESGDSGCGINRTRFRERSVKPERDSDAALCVPSRLEQVAAGRRLQSNAAKA